MPSIDAFILAAIVVAFVAFAALLLWGEYRTRNVRQITRPRLIKSGEKHEPVPTASARPAANRRQNVA